MCFFVFGKISDGGGKKGRQEKTNTHPKTYKRREKKVLFLHTLRKSTSVQLLPNAEKKEILQIVFLSPLT